MRVFPTNYGKTSAVVGLDIGSDAVRAAELTHSRKGLLLRRWGQVDLPVGAVVGGSIVDPPRVASALRRLWSDTGFSTRNVVVAMSGQGVLVRHADVPTMSTDDFRLSLKFQASELIPIPVDEAIMDFVVVPSAAGDERPGNEMAILLAAARKTVVAGIMSLLRDASLKAVALDPAATASVRVTRWAAIGGTGTVALVDIGAELTVITVREGGLTRFTRTLDSGGSQLMARRAQRLAKAVAEDGRPERHGAITAEPAGPAELEPGDVDHLATQIEGSLSFFAGQMATSGLTQVCVTGAPSRSRALIDALAGRLPAPVSVLDALDGLNLSSASWSEEERRSASTTALLAVGAAEWPFDQPGERLSLLPPEIAQAAALRRKVGLVGVAAAVLVVGLGALSVHRSHEVAKQKGLVALAQGRGTGLHSELSRLSPLTATQEAVQARVAVAGTAFGGDIAWPSLLAKIATAMPSGTQMTSCNFTSSALTAPASTAAATASPKSVGSVTMGVNGQGSEEVVATWLRAMATVKGLTDVLVPSASVSDGKVTFSATATVTNAAPMVRLPVATAGARS